jgi:hypothetical protein
MLIDCDRCSVRGAACGGCVVTLLFEAPPAVHRLDEAEVRAIEMLTRAGFEVTVLEPTHETRSISRRARRFTAA